MKTIGTIALALIGICLATTPADAGRKKGKKKAKAAKIEEAPRRLTDAMGGGLKLATPTGVTKKTIAIDEQALASAGDTFELGRTDRAADMPDGEEKMRVEGVRLTSIDAGEVVKGNWDKIDYCWNKLPSALRDPLETSLRFTVDPRGTVLSVEIDGEAPAKFSSCVKLAAKKWQFPIADGESTVEFPISLR